MYRLLSLGGMYGGPFAARLRYVFNRGAGCRETHPGHRRL